MPRSPLLCVAIAAALQLSSSPTSLATGRRLTGPNRPLKRKRIRESFYNLVSGPVAPGRTVKYSVGIYNPDPISYSGLFAHVWVGSGNVDPVVGTFLMNADARFPRLSQPAFDGLALGYYASAILTFGLKVPSFGEGELAPCRRAITSRSPKPPAVLAPSLWQQPLQRDRTRS